jgi:hypothetical protein
LADRLWIESIIAQFISTAVAADWPHHAWPMAASHRMGTAEQERAAAGRGAMM